MSRNTSRFTMWGWADGAKSARLGLRRKNRRTMQPAVFELDARLLLSTMIVRNTSDNPNNTKSLRYAVDHAASGTTIKFAPNVTGTITLTHGQLDINKNLVINGPGAGKLTIDGNNATRIFAVQGGVTATINGLTIADGNPGNDYGGGLSNSGTVNLKNDFFYRDQAGDSYYGGGIYNNGTANLTNCTFSQNSAGEHGGGMYNNATANLSGCTFVDNSTSEQYYGAGLYNDGTVNLNTCTFTQNQALGDGGGVYNNNQATVLNCTFNGNDADFGFNGGGLYNNDDVYISGNTFNGDIANHGYGGGLYNSSNGGMQLVDSTINGCTAAYTGGGVCNVTGADLSVVSCTISGNSAGTTGGGIEIDTFALGSPEDLNIVNTIIAANTATGGGGDVYAEFNAPNFSGGNNLVGNTNGSSGYWISSDLTDKQAQPLNLAPLGNNGGSTQTMALLPGSAAIGTGVVANGVGTDQRGVARTAGKVDIGAFQDRGFKIRVVPGDSPQSTKGNNAFAKPLAVIVSSPSGDPVLGGASMITFTAPSSGASAILNANTAPIGTNGRAKVTASANGATGSFSVTATVKGAIKPAIFALTNRGQATGRAKLAMGRGARAEEIGTMI